jgi:hypothetical protein
VVHQLCSKRVKHTGVNKMFHLASLSSLDYSDAHRRFLGIEGRRAVENYIYSPHYRHDALAIEVVSNRIFYEFRRDFFLRRLHDIVSMDQETKVPPAFAEKFVDEIARTFASWSTDEDDHGL